MANHTLALRIAKALSVRVHSGSAAMSGEIYRTVQRGVMQLFLTSVTLLSRASFASHCVGAGSRKHQVCCVAHTFATDTSRSTVKCAGFPVCTACTAVRGGRLTRNHIGPSTNSSVLNRHCFCHAAIQTPSILNDSQRLCTEFSLMHGVACTGMLSMQLATVLLRQRDGLARTYRYSGYM